MSKKAEGFSLRFVLINTGNISRKVLSKVLRSFDKNFERLQRGNYLTVILKEYKASVQEKEFRKPAGAMPLFEDHSDHLIERFRLVAEGKQSSSRIGRILVPVIAVALLVLSYSLILQPRYEEPENAYDMENSIWNIDQKDAYLYEVDGKYYVYSEHKTLPIDRKGAEFMKKSGFKFKKGGN